MDTKLRITAASPEMLPDLKMLWRELYPEDSDRYIDLFFACRFLPETTAVLRREEEIIGVMYLLPYPGGFYAYAGGIAKAHRGAGCFRYLMETIVSACRKAGVSLCLVPGKGLWEFYRSLGLNRTFWRKAVTIQAEYDGIPLHMTTCLGADYREKRAAILPPESPEWDAAALTYAAWEASFEIGGLFQIFGDFGEGTALLSRRGSELLVQETTLSEAAIRAAAPELCRCFAAAYLTVHQPCGADDPKREAAALLLGDGDSPGWFALGLVE